MSIHNLGYYQNIYNWYHEFKENNATRKSIFYFINPESFIINPLSNLVVRQIFTPSIKWGYKAAGRVAVNLSSCLNTALSQRIDGFWHDPLSTEKLLKIGGLIQSLSYATAMRTPKKLPLIHYLDRSLISLARHCYIFSKDMNSILRIPQTLRSYITWTALDAEVEEPSSYIGKGWKYVRFSIAILNEGIFRFIYIIFKIVTFPFRYIPFLIPLIEKIKEKISNHFYIRLVKKAQQAIDTKEKLIRKKLIGKIASTSLHQGLFFLTTTSIKVSLSIKSYALTNQVIFRLLGLKEVSPYISQIVAVGLTGLRCYLWMRCIIPTFNNLHRNYQETFNPQASTFFELRHLFDMQKLAKVINFARAKLFS